MKNKICVMGIYFGKFPNYISLWLKSCEKNPKIDFFVFCDNPIDQCPPNVIMVPTSLDEVQSRLSAIAGFECFLDRPYKLCDYKPLFGLIFGEYVKGYDYWGHCDFDLIFGDLMFFFQKYNLHSYDRFLALGHLSLYRNTDEVNYRFRCEGSDCDYKTVFTTDKICVFDELPGMTRIYEKNDFPIFCDCIFVDVASVYDRYRIIDIYPYGEKNRNYPKQIFYWENGKCYRAFFKENALCKEEYQYIHFKKRPNFSVDFDLSLCDSFYITKFGFIPKDGEVTMEIIDRYNPYKGKLYENAELLRYKWEEFACRLKNKLNRIFRGSK